jgi:hypothetical protein
VAGVSGTRPIGRERSPYCFPSVFPQFWAFSFMCLIPLKTAGAPSRSRLSCYRTLREIVVLLFRRELSPYLRVRVAKMYGQCKSHHSYIFVFHITQTLSRFIFLVAKIPQTPR